MTQLKNQVLIYQRSKINDLVRVETDCKEIPCGDCVKTIQQSFNSYLGSGVTVRCYQQYTDLEIYYEFVTSNRTQDIESNHEQWRWFGNFR